MTDDQDKPVSVDHTPEGEGVTLGTEHPDQAAMLAAQLAQTGAQMETVWESLLAAMTENGATRQDIAVLTSDVAQTIVNTTMDALWPDDVVPPGEEKTASLFRDIRSALAAE